MPEVVATTAVESEALNLIGNQPALVVTSTASEPYWQDIAGHLPAVLVVTVEDVVNRVATIPHGSVVVLDRIADRQPRPVATELVRAVRDADPSTIVFTGPLPDMPARQHRSRSQCAPSASVELLWRLTAEGSAATWRGAIAELAREL